MVNGKVVRVGRREWMESVKREDGDGDGERGNERSGLMEGGRARKWVRM
jgi:hypothetical protein